MKIIVSLLLLCSGIRGFSQILDVTPAFPSEDDTVTIIYDALSGNGALNNYSGDVYAHAGLITSKSSSATDWKFVQGTWGTNDLKVKMTAIGNNKFKIKYHIRSFYGLPAGETILKLAFVFRNLDGSKVGREADGSDIFFTLGKTGFDARISSHSSVYIFAKLGDSILINGVSSANANLDIIVNGVKVRSTTGTDISYRFGINSTCLSIVYLKAESTSSTIYDTLYIFTPDLNNIEVWPADAEDGITYLSSLKFRFSLYAPGKEFVYLIGDFNNWMPSCTYQLKKTPDGKRFWLDISGFTPGKEHVFQYLVDGKIKIADPYSRVILDPANDNSIPTSTYPNLKAYPHGKTTGQATLLLPVKSPFAWQVNTFSKPKKTDLVIYELLIRDFIAAKNYKTLKDTLAYLKRLGVNCIELMPVMEFEGNNSWGYNVSYHAALDKAYGTMDDIKRFIDECHKNNIAVVLDIVLNHLFSQSSLCQLYWDAANFQPASNNPWINVTARHPFNVGYDMNHESSATQYYIDKVIRYWLEEFKVDGFRFDLSKGFTQKYTGSDVNAWGQYDQSRINILKRMGDKIRLFDSTAFLILEHFADNSEEKVLSDDGFMFWGNLVHAYNESTMGYTSDLSWGDYKQRGWGSPNLVTYLESHDEERLMVKNTKFGGSSGSYNTKDLATALKRMELAGVFFFTIPGPKMFWQFGELGYDISIDQNGRTGEKPVNWFYESNTNRKNLYNTWGDLIKLKTEQEVFETKDYSANLSGITKSIYLNSPGMKVAVLGNFGLVSSNVSVNFQQSGTWYEFFNGDSITISTVPHIFNFAPGEYRLYSTSRLNRVYQTLGSTKFQTLPVTLYPNPAGEELIIDLGENFGQVEKIELMDVTGRAMPIVGNNGTNSIKIDVSNFEDGIYLVRVFSSKKTFVERFLKK